MVFVALLAQYVCRSINQPLQVLHVGGAGHKALLVLDGDADAYVFPQDGTKRWDTCAVDAILHAAGKLLLTSVTPAGTAASLHTPW